MSVLGILTCEILEMEFAYLLFEDPDLERITVLDDERSARMIQGLESGGNKALRRIRQVSDFVPSNTGRMEVFVQVLELGLHNRRKSLQQGLLDAARKLDPYLDVLVLGYGLCGNALENPNDLLSDIDAPVFIPMDEGHAVDDCVGLIIGGRNRYYTELCNVAGTFFMIPGWTYHWKRMFERGQGNLSVELARRLFAHYERSLLITTPIMPVQDMHRNVEPFNELFGFRTEVREGTLRILNETWKKAKAYLGLNRE
jgi:hypothetical protein